MIDIFGKDMEKISDRLMSPKRSCGIDLNITKECNFRCSYCYEGGSCFALDDISERLDDVFCLIDSLLLQDWFLLKFNSIKMGIWGGEPTLRPDILKRIVDKYRDNSMVEYLIYTNGQGVNVIKDVFGCIKDRVHVQVSYDGGEIHKVNRPDKHGNDTSEMCRGAVLELHGDGYNVSIKSTIDPTKDLSLMVGAWDDIKTLYDEVGDNISYAITPDNIRDGDFDVELWKSVIKDIAKREIKFYGENGRHLLRWFGGEKVKCVYFEGGFFVDTNGDLMHCHGCGYFDNKTDFVFGHVSDDGVMDAIRSNMGRFKTPGNATCEKCVSTMCLSCNSAKYINSRKTDFFDKWYDFTCQKKHCELFREFGKIDRAVKEILGR